MGLNCGCPVGASLTSLTNSQCKQSFGQIQKLLFQRRAQADGTLNKISSTVIITLAGWNALLAVNDYTKVTVSPEIGNPETEPGEPLTFGGNDNTTPGGQEIILGRGPTAFTSVLYEEDQALIKKLKDYQCEDLAVYFVDEYGNIGCYDAGDDNNVQQYRGVPVKSFFVGDKDFGGFSEPDSNALNFSLPPNWSDNLVILKQSTFTDNFNPLTDLVNPV